MQRWEAECASRLPALCDGRVGLSCGVNDTVIENGAVRVRPEESCLNVWGALHRAFFPLVSDAEDRRDVLSSDGAHPRSSGYTKIAQIVLSSPSWWFHRPDFGN
ncbi:MAG TPA: hypothetical protein PKE64_15620 [Anaerolineae bacterium]|nr:hypothetical protein [Anaerolineae bacterium]HMR65434.1 hypothetical protein [Anaerolineae bacterium]